MNDFTTVALRHVAFEDAGLWDEVLHPTYVDVGVDFPATAPAITDADLLIVLGGPVNATDPRFPYLADEIELIRSRLATGRPVLGVCLGAQLLALALGGEVRPGRGPMQIGWSPVTLTPEGLESPLASLADRPVLHWHGDSIALPVDEKAVADGVERLAFDDVTPVQAFRSRYALGLQFHVEADRDRIEQWFLGHVSELDALGYGPEELDRFREETLRYGSELSGLSQDLVVDWLRGLGEIG
jgi:GMP synthase (glutamine-hydrolysing)